ncbi:uncharacterized protein LOC103179716 [Callorhinchus milii]|uniref:uncharacterized protein LOC103179716 n=1 Tax=Callorhinchus milii TaxID=7868 RepID=UPI001C3F78E6|nr:uncharacterized protein LOC103179716 [Callorhinchus milii]XP_007893298.2 uncharacterized protein LOC103179716 [Callorhinchus milii]XP_007893299.2 uncharacterized protein LOC103179716 [Callorhinchus milii]
MKNVVMIAKKYHYSEAQVWHLQVTEYRKRLSQEGKAKKKKESEGLMYTGKEDLETPNRGPTPPPNPPGNIPDIYPDLHAPNLSQLSPPPYIAPRGASVPALNQSYPQRKTPLDSPTTQWVKENFSMEYPQIDDLGDGLVAPMIQVADGKGVTQYVYRAWGMEDVKRAMAACPHPSQGATEFRDFIHQAMASYRLNSLEIEQCLREVLRQEWCQVGGDWTALTQERATRPYVDPPEAAERPGNNYWGPLDALMGRIATYYKARCNYSAITDCVQGKDETCMQYYTRLRKVFNSNSGIEPPNPHDDNGVWAQQIKNAYLAGAAPQIAKLVKQHLITWSTGALQPVLDHAMHFERMLREEKRQRMSRENGPSTFSSQD